MFRFQLWIRWNQIAADATIPRRHCSPDAQAGDTCPTAGGDSKWFARCPCEPGSPFHSSRPIDGPTFFVVPNNTVNQWWQKLLEIVDFDQLGISLESAHTSLPSPGFSNSVVSQLLEDPKKRFAGAHGRAKGRKHLHMGCDYMAVVL